MSGPFVTEVEGILLENVHPMDSCVGEPCIIHNPTDHHMRHFKLHWREDRRIFERICPHGVGHPDPDQWFFWRKTNQEWQGRHGCDGCCRPKEQG